MKHCLLVLLLFSSYAFAQKDDGPLIDDTAYIYRSLSAALENPEKVYRLNLSKDRLKVFPADIFKLKNLRDLDMSRNKIDSVPPAIGALSNLQRLNLSNNKIVQLPDEIGKLTSLTYLGLNRNVLVSLPASIGNLENLEVLELWDNELDTIPEEITKCRKLKVLELRGILFSDEEHARLDTLLPDAKVYLSPSCNCKN
jgi:Leucine-rich repeat (LRR) protein